MIEPTTKQGWACPLNGKRCVDGVREDFPTNEVGGKVTCRWWQHIAGKDPQSEKHVDQFDCAIAWLPVLAIEGSQMSRQTGASADKIASQVLDLKQALAATNTAIRLAAAGIAQAVEAGSLTVMLPPPAKPDSPNGKGLGLVE